MQITLMAVGSRGDVQPLVALGRGLQKRGHQVHLVAGDEYENIVRCSGVDFKPLGVNLQSAMDSHTDVFRFMTSMKNRIVDSVAENQDAIVSTFLGVSTCPLARARHIPFFYALPIPSVQTRDFPNPLFPALPLGKGYNALTHKMAEKRVCQMYNDARLLFMEPRPTYLCCYSPEVVPRPTDWEEYVHVTGYWFLDVTPEFQPPVALMEFLQAGPPPVAISLGSGRAEAAERATTLGIEALSVANQRGVVLTGWRKAGTLREVSHCLVTDSIPFDWLFPRVAAAVHHGGAGTTAAAIRAGIPSVVVPFGLDQSFWGRQVQKLGVGLGPFDQKLLTAKSLAAVIRQVVEDSQFRSSAAILGEKVCREDGVGNAASIVERVVSAWR
jgi:sterol 3beta-glucosyltransferase